MCAFREEIIDDNMVLDDDVNMVIDDDTNTINMVLDNMEMNDILHIILYIDIVKHNEIHNVDYFKARLKNNPIDDKLKNDAICILEKLNDEMENLVNEECPEYQDIRRENLNILVSLCEQIVDI